MDQPQQQNISITHKQIIWLLAALIGSAAIIRLMVGYTRVHYFDLSFYVDWSAGAASDLFGAYENVGNLDYPPLFLFPLFFTGKFMQADALSTFHPYAMLLLKGWQILFDIAIIPLLYGILRAQGEKVALASAVLWAVNPTALYNSSYWGQTDCIMIFLLLLTFWLLTTHRPVWSGVVMTLACLMKFQSLYFAPLFALVLLTSFPIKKILQTIGGGIVTALAVFFPFMLRSGWTLPLKIYLGGFHQYSSASMNAFNFYSANGRNSRPSSEPLIGVITSEQFSSVMIVIALILLVMVYFTAHQRSVWLIGFLFMQTIFLFTTRMHERYQIPVVAFMLVAWAYHKKLSLFICYLIMTVMTFLNHFLVLERVFTGDKTLAWVGHFDQIAIVMGYVNLALYLLTAFLTARVLYAGEPNPIWHKPKPIQDSSEPSELPNPE